MSTPAPIDTAALEALVGRQHRRSPFVTRVTVQYIWAGRQTTIRSVPFFSTHPLWFVGLFGDRLTVTR